MKEFDFLRNVSIGIYSGADSVIHRLNPGTKLTSVVLLITTVLLISNPLLLLGLFILILGMVVLSKIGLKSIFRSFLPIIPFITVIGILQILFVKRFDTGTYLFTIADTKIITIIVTVEELLEVLKLFIRFFCMMTLLTLFSKVTNTSEISHGTEKFFKPFARLGFPAHEFSLLITITFRFIPILAIEAEKLAKAQAARGAQIGTHKGGFLRRVRAFFPLLIPLFTNALTRAEYLVEAMEVRCYTGGKGRTSFVEYPYGSADTLSLISVFTIFIAVLLLRVIQFVI